MTAPLTRAIRAGLAARNRVIFGGPGEGEFSVTEATVRAGLTAALEVTEIAGVIDLLGNAATALDPEASLTSTTLAEGIVTFLLREPS